MNAPQTSDVWRLAALTMMPRSELEARLGSGNPQSLQWIASAAHCGLAEAQLRLGGLLLEGDGIAQDKAAAFAWFEAAASSGNADAQNMLGRCYEMGWGVSPDMARAARCYGSAARAGLDWAQYNLGHLLLDGLGVSRNRDAAFDWYSRAAAQGHVRAMNLVGRCCEEGWGTKRDLERARECYRQSAMGRYFRGAYNYASILSSEGCIAGARFWFARAITQASPQSKTNILAALGSHPDASIRALAPTSC